jgi:hypothetical protein
MVSVQNSWSSPCSGGLWDYVGEIQQNYGNVRYTRPGFVNYEKGKVNWICTPQNSRRFGHAAEYWPGLLILYHYQLVPAPARNVCRLLKDVKQQIQSCIVT